MYTSYNLSKDRSVALIGDQVLFTFEVLDILERLHSKIVELYKDGYRNFYCGLDAGFSILAGELVVAMQEKCPELVLTAAVAFPDQGCRYKPDDRSRYDDLFKKADQVMTLSERWFPGCMLIRSDFMIEHSSCVVAYTDGSADGDAHEVCDRARKLGLQVHNLY